MGPSFHFYSHMDPVWSLLIVGTGFVPWVELPVQRRLCPIFVSGVGLLGRVFHRLTGCQRTPWKWGVTAASSERGLPEYSLYLKGGSHDGVSNAQ